MSGSQRWSSNPDSWSGLSILLGAGALVVKGAGIIFFKVDLSLVPLATLLFALGLVGFSTRPDVRSGRMAAIGIFLLYVAVAASLLNLVALILHIPAPNHPSAPLLLRISYPTAFFGILLGPIGLGLAGLRSQSRLARWRGVPLAMSLIWFPLIGLGELIYPDGLGMILAGFAWSGLGYVLWSEKGERISLSKSM